MQTHMVDTRDQIVKEHVEQSLKWAPEVEAPRIGVAVREGVVTLYGQVPSFWQKTQAGKIALRTRGVSGIANDMVVHRLDDPRTDSDIALAAHHLLKCHADVPHESVKVKVEDHVLALTGDVTWNFQREAAFRCVEHLTGVRDVRNRIALRPRPEAAAAETETLIRRAIMRHASLDASRVHARVDGARIVLTGTVSSDAEKRAAAAAAWSSPHVDEVENRISVDRDLSGTATLTADEEEGKQMRTTVEQTYDRDVQDAVERALRWAPEVEAAKIGVAVQGGVVTLTGQVASYWQKLMAGKTALRTHGVTALANDIMVHHVSDPRTDSDIATAAHHVLAWNSAIPKDSVKIEVEEHVITLTGEVVWHYQRELAERLVEHLIGVKAVHNRITLEPRPPVSASETESLIRRALIRNASIDAREVKVAVDGTHVVLTGTVSSYAERKQAERAAWSSPHVEHVDNRISVELCD